MKTDSFPPNSGTTNAFSNRTPFLYGLTSFCLSYVIKIGGKVWININFELAVLTGEHVFFKCIFLKSALRKTNLILQISI
jgi:hypothetical protein